MSGRYFDDCREARTSAAAREADVAARLWEVSAGLAGLAG